jgi:hypothetical protein
VANFRIPRKPTPVRKKNGGTTKSYRPLKKPTPVRKKNGGTTQSYRPLKKNESVKVKSGPHRDGDYEMSEVTMTFEDPSGKFVVVPSIYMNENNKPVQFTKESQVFNAAMNYEQSSGKKFPRFNTQEEADNFAEKRSDSGGVRNGPLAK